MLLSKEELIFSFFRKASFINWIYIIEQRNKISMARWRCDAIEQRLKLLGK